VPITAIAPPVDNIDSLASGLSSYLNRDQVNGIRRAYYYAEQAHEGQFRRSGEPYVTHPLAVAGILCEMHMDPQSLMAAMLHDVIEDTGIRSRRRREQAQQDDFLEPRRGAGRKLSEDGDGNGQRPAGYFG